MCILESSKGYVDSGINIKSHFMDATGIIEFSSDAAKLIGHSKMIKTATYGKEYYGDFDQYVDQLSLDTNILYVEK